jgi:putative oxidoreductase
MNMSKWSSALLSVLRIMSGLLFLEHGTSKEFGFPPEMAAAHAGPAPAHYMVLMHQGSGVLELVGGILLVVGLFTRLSAFILSGEMAVAYFMVHAKMGFYPINNHGEIAVLYCFVFLYLAAAGAGPFSLDRLRHKA